MVAASSKEAEQPVLVRRINALEAHLDPRRRTTTWADVGVLWGLYLACISIQPTLATVNYVRFQWAQVSQSKAAEFLGLLPLDSPKAPTLSQDTSELTKGQTVAGYKVTSDVGPRTAPGGVGSTNHQGIDLATPSGVKVYAPVRTKVTCLNSPGGGIGARFKGVRGEVTLWHLSHCAEGSKAPGDVLAMTGNTGTATTGPHLHVEVRVNSEITNPQVRDVEPLLGGGRDLNLDRYVAAIAKKESSATDPAVNPHSGALGKFQFMPDTMKAQAKACLDREPSKQEFLSNPELQNTVMRCYVKDKLPTIEKKSKDPQTQCRMLASTHYSGNPDLWDDTRTQRYNGHAYPSIADYTEAICKEVM